MLCRVQKNFDKINKYIIVKNCIISDILRIKEAS